MRILEEETFLVPSSTETGTEEEDDDDGALNRSTTFSVENLLQK